MTAMRKTPAVPDGSAVSVRHLAFDLSKRHPIQLMRYRWAKPRAAQYDKHYGLEVGILLRGKMRRVDPKEAVDVKPGQAWLCGSWEPHGCQILAPESEAVVFRVFPPLLANFQFSELPLSRWIAPATASINVPNVTEAMRDRLLELGRNLDPHKSGRGAFQQIWLRLRLFEILVTLQKPQTPSALMSRDAGFAERIFQAMELVFNSRSLVTTQQAAKACLLRRNILSRVFQKTLGMTFSEFGLRYRISKVAEDLLNSHTPVKALSDRWGFNDPSHLYRHFAKHYRCTPIQYRKRSDPLISGKADRRVARNGACTLIGT